MDLNEGKFIDFQELNQGLRLNFNSHKEGLRLHLNTHKGEWIKEDERMRLVTTPNISSFVINGWHISSSRVKIFSQNGGLEILETRSSQDIFEKEYPLGICFMERN